MIASVWLRFYGDYACNKRSLKCTCQSMNDDKYVCQLTLVYYNKNSYERRASQASQTRFNEDLSWILDKRLPFKQYRGGEV